FNREQRYPDARTMQGDVRALRRGEAPSYAAAAGKTAPAIDVPAAPPESFTSGQRRSSNHGPMLATAATALDPASRSSTVSNARSNDAATEDGATRVERNVRMLLWLLAALAALIVLGCLIGLLRSARSADGQTMAGAPSASAPVSLDS